MNNYNKIDEQLIIILFLLGRKQIYKLCKNVLQSNSSFELSDILYEITKLKNANIIIIENNIVMLDKEFRDYARGLNGIVNYETIRKFYPDYESITIDNPIALSSAENKKISLTIDKERNKNKAYHSASYYTALRVLLLIPIIGVFIVGYLLQDMLNERNLGWVMSLSMIIVFALVVYAFIRLSFQKENKK